MSAPYNMRPRSILKPDYRSDPPKLYKKADLEVQATAASGGGHELLDLTHLPLSRMPDGNDLDRERLERLNPGQQAVQVRGRLRVLEGNQDDMSDTLQEVKGNQEEIMANQQLLREEQMSHNKVTNGALRDLQKRSKIRDVACVVAFLALAGWVLFH